MSKKDKRDRKTRGEHARRRQHSKLWPIGILVLGAGLVVVWVFFPRSEPWGLPAIPQNPRPGTLSPEMFTGKVAQVYRIAQKVPELVEQMPCYCGCYVSDRHRNNLDCYTDRHSVGWRICQDITLDAYAMYQNGRKIDDIKKAIDAKYSRFWPFEKKWPL